MAAISDDTAALVAAQLTVAWAIKTGEIKGSPVVPITSSIYKVYDQFREAAREVDGPSAFDNV